MIRCSRGVRLAGCVLTLMAVGPGASAQTPTVPVPITAGCTLENLRDKKPTEALTAAFQSGDWELFKQHVATIRQHFEKNHPCHTGAVDVSASDYLLVVWPGETPLGDAALLSAIVKDEHGEGYAARLPGLSANSASKLYQLFVSDSKPDVLASAYLSTREEDPLLKQIPDVAAKILDPMLALMIANLGSESLAKARGESDEEKKKALEAKGWAALSRVDLPYARAAVKVEMKAALFPSADRVKKTSTKLLNKLKLIDVPYSAEAKKLAERLDGIVQDDENARACLDASPPETCLSVLDPKLDNVYDGTCAGCGREESNARRLVDTKYRALLTAVGPEEVKASSELHNVPLRKYSFGLMTAFSFWRTSNAPRVKVDEGVLEHDPLDRAMTMVTFNVAFKPYDGDAFSITKDEKHRWFFGAAITPTFGIGAGYSYLPIRGLGINVGYALLGINTADGGKQVGEAPVSTNDPFKLGVTGAAFMGLSYNFK